MFALVKKLARVSRHDFGFCVAALRAGQNGVQGGCRHEVYL